MSSFSSHWNSKRLVWAIIALLCAGLLAGLPLLTGQAQDDNPPGLDEASIIRATVFVMSIYNTPGGTAISCVRSGTLVSADGLILTNAHSVADSERCPADDIAISLARRADEPPILTYYADVINADLGLDLAVLQIARQLDGRPLDSSTLSLPFVELGDSSQVQLDDTITVFGYPGLGNDPVKVERGTVVGFLAERGAGNRAWIKTQATIEGTMSGGGAYNAAGQLVGIPTTAPASVGEATLDCRRIQDTSGDGLVDSRDDCVPLSGFIDGMRPAALAAGLVRATRLGVLDEGHQFSTRGFIATDAPQGAPTFSNLFFSPAANEAGLPQTRVTQLPAGSTSLFLFFDYTNMQPGTIYELQVTREGILESRFSLSPVLWSGGVNGLWYVGTDSQPWPNGVYEFTLRIEGERAASAQITIGGGPSDEPAFTDVVLGVPDLQGNMMGGGYVVPEGDSIDAQFIYRNLRPDISWAQRWYYQGQALQQEPIVLPWALQTNGAASFQFNGNPQLRPGQYRLELFIEDRLATMVDFIVAGGRDGAFARIFENVRFASELVDGQPAGAVSENFQNPTTDLYAFVDWRFLAPGTPWTYRWLVDGNALFERDEVWAGPESGTNFWLHLGAERQLPDGSYTVQIWIGGSLFAEQTARVGIGQLTAVQGDEASGVHMFGQIVDAETGQGITDALFILLEAEFSVEDFDWNQDKIYDSSRTDLQGRFDIQRFLPRDAFYSVIILADGYLPVTADGIYLEPDAEGQLELLLEMNRD